jgi:cell wall-associated NlpC family hydrolase
VSRAELVRTARPRRGPSVESRGSRRPTWLASVAATLAAATSLPLLLVQHAAADPLADARAEAAQISAQIQQDGQRLDVLSQQYDAAEQQIQQLGAQIAQIQAQIVATKQRVTAAQVNLRRQALSAYMNGTDTGLDSLFSAGGTRPSLAQEYRSVAAGNLQTAIDALHRAQAALSSQQSALQTSQAQAQAAAQQAAAARQAALATQQQQENTLNQVKGQIATLVEQQREAELRAQQLAFEQRLAAQAAAAKAAAGGGRSDGAAAAANVPVSPGAAGAVQAAQSQLGVPYVWGGESPGVGFDCSGLTQWSWGRAGVSIPRTAQEQYDAIVHVSLSALEPGDLLFWNDGTSSVQHVAMYVGNGEVIQAPQTGEVVSYSPIWNNGLVGAGRP